MLENSPRTETENRLEECWSWVGVALFLLITLDLLTSLYAAEIVGLEHESNVLMRWILGQLTGVVVLIHLTATVLIVGFFHGIFEIARQVSPRYRSVAVRGLELYIGLLVAAGLFVFANNISVIILGGSLL